MLTYLTNKKSKEVDSYIEGTGKLTNDSKLVEILELDYMFEKNMFLLDKKNSL